MKLSEKKKIFVICHERRIAELNEKLASAFELTYSDGSEESLQTLSSGEDVAVLLLCGDKEIDTNEILRQIADMNISRALPVLAVGQVEDEAPALAAGATGFAYEPILADVLRQRIRNLLWLLHAESSHDALTGLLSRQQFMIEADQYRKRNPDQELVMLYTNIERFRILNDLYGQATGDEVLRGLGSRFAQWCGRNGVIGRVSGDHFAIFCPADRVKPKTLQEISLQLMDQYHLQCSLRVTYGIYEVENSEISIQQMCDRAQMALTTLEAGNSGFFAYYDEKLRKELLLEQEITDGMETALESGQFHIYLQPIYSLSTGKPVSAEALVRWFHPEKGVISPGQFIPVFEHNGFISRLDAYVWETVFQYLAAFRRMGYPDFPVSANMSRMDFYNAEICDNLIAMAQKYDVDPSTFRIEITESAYMDNPQQLMEAIKKFNAAGFQVLMDDFGSGYSSLNMLMDIPVSTLKIDMGFVRDVGKSERSNSVITSVIRMAKWLEMTVVAEGVETRTQLDYLKSIGCDRVQGFYYSKPLPIEEFNGLITNFQRDQLLEPTRTFDKIDIDEVWNIVMDRNSLVSSMLGAAGLYEVSGDNVEILSVNDEYYHVMRTTPERLFRETNNALGWCTEESKRQIHTALRRAWDTGKRQDLIVSRYITSAKTIRLLLSVYYIGRKDNRKIYLVCGKDVSTLITTQPEAEIKTAEQTACPIVPRTDRRKILIVEDNQVNRIMLRKMLSDEYEVLEAGNGREALDLLACNLDIAAILLDIIMPIMGGYEFLECKQKDGRIRGIPVLVLSQAESKDSERQALELGANDFVHKPYEPATLKRRLVELVPNFEHI